VVATFEEPLPSIRYRTAGDIQKRKREFIDHSDAFVILPGGWGTLDELLDVIIGKEIVDRHRRYARPVRFKEDRPIILVNTEGFYEPFLALARRNVREGFMMASDMELFHVAKTPAAAFAIINRYRKK
jgi:uncharacterized protein (TIGR00730 family)